MAHNIGWGCYYARMPTQISSLQNHPSYAKVKHGWSTMHPAPKETKLSSMRTGKSHTKLENILIQFPTKYYKENRYNPFQKKCRDNIEKCIRHNTHL
jgi:hypothetical protein